MAVALGVDAIGIILHAKSPRLIDTDTAIAVREKVPESVSLVGVFVDAQAHFINRCISDIGLDLVQLHGNESNGFGHALNAAFIKAIRVRHAEHLAKQLNAFPAACALLLDPYVKGQHGGTGVQLDSSSWPRDTKQKLVLAGGLSAQNVATACAATSPYAVDLNSGVESAPGIKDRDLLSSALREIRTLS